MKTIASCLLSSVALAAFVPATHAGPSTQFVQVMDQIREARQHPAHLASLDAQNPAWVAKAKAGYPLETCVVSGEPLSQPLDYVYIQPGKSERLVRFSSAKSVEQFKQSPGQYLSKIDEAARRHLGQ